VLQLLQQQCTNRQMCLGTVEQQQQQSSSRHCCRRRRCLGTTACCSCVVCFVYCDFVDYSMMCVCVDVWVCVAKVPLEQRARTSVW
jgi:hypothetical protein